MTDSQLQLGKFEVANPVDITEDQARLDNQILESEQNYINGLIANADEQDRINEKTWDSLAKFSKSAAETAKALRDQKRQERAELIAFKVTEYGLSEDLIDLFKSNENLLWEDGRLITKAGVEYMEATGDAITALEFLDMNDWEKHQVVKAWVKNQAMEYPSFYQSMKDTVSIEVNGETKTYNDVLTKSEMAALDAKILQEFTRRFANVNEALIATEVKPIVDEFKGFLMNQRIQEAATALKEQDNEIVRRNIENFFIVEGDDELTQANYEALFNDLKLRNPGLSDGLLRQQIVETIEGIIKDPNNDLTSLDFLPFFSSNFVQNGGAIIQPTQWKEYENVFQVFGDADIAKRESQNEDFFSEAKEERFINFILQTENIDENQREEIKQVLTESYGGDWSLVPFRVKEALLRDHIDDASAKAFIEAQIKNNGGNILYHHDLYERNFSSTVINEYLDKTKGEQAEYTFVPEVQWGYFDEDILDRINAFTNDGAGNTLGDPNTRDNRWFNLNNALIDYYADRMTYYRELGDGKTQEVLTPEAARNQALRDIEELVGNEVEIAKLLAGYNNPDVIDADALNSEKYRNKIDSTGDQFDLNPNAWKTGVISVDKEDYEQLIDWWEGGGLTIDAPQLYLDIANANYINPTEFLLQQVENTKKFMQEYPTIFGERTFFEDASEDEREDNEQIIELLNSANNGQVTDTKLIVSYVDYNNLNTDENQIFNQENAFLNPDLFAV